MFKLATPNRFARSTIKHFSRAVCGIMLLAIISPLPAVDLLYVSMSNTIVRFDTTGNNVAIIAATMSTFVNSNLSVPYCLAFDSSGNLLVRITATAAAI